MIRDILSDRGLVTIEADAKVVDACKLMREKNVGAVLICHDDGKPRGILTDRDVVVRCLAKHIDTDDCTIEQVMTESLETVRDTDGMFDCIQKMHDACVKRMPVVDENGKAVGIVTFSDLIGIFGKELHLLASTTTYTGEQEEKIAA